MHDGGPVSTLRFGLRAAATMAADLGTYGRRTGRWWLPLAILVIVAASALAAATAKVVVPVALYTFA